MPNYVAKSSKSWILWLLLVLLLLAAAGYLLYKNRHTMTAAVAPTSTATASALTSASTSPSVSSISDLTGFLATTNPVTENGKTVDFINANVTAVTGDKTFAVGASTTSQVYVLLDPQLNSGAAEQAVQVKVGQQLHIVGTIKQMPDLSQIESQWSLNEADATAAQKFGVYIEASSIVNTQANQ